jgi:hypothetical protein
MDKIREIDQKISDLKSKQDLLRKKAAEAFYKKAETLLGTDFSPELALGILSTSWANKDDKIREVWQTKAHTFRGSQNPHPKKEAV